MLLPRRIFYGCVSLVFLAAASALASVDAPARRLFSESVAPVPASAAPGRLHVTRVALTAAERAAPIDVVISLTMRNYDEFEQRIQSGAHISQSEMEEKYLPLPADHDRVRDWLLAQGFTQTLVDSNHTNLFVTGTVDQTAAAFQVQFARVASADGEFTSAISAPSVPAELGAAILNIEGLQPHVQMHPTIKNLPATLPTTLSGFATPPDVIAAYKLPPLATGSGQTIAVYGWSVVSLSDLTSFWNAIGSTQSASNVTIVNPGVGLTDSADIEETSLDTEWSGAVAPAAKLRVYSQSKNTSGALLTVVTQVMNDAKKDASITVFNYSGGASEQVVFASSYRASSQIFGQLIAMGITPLVSSGDAGSNPDPNGNDYLASAPLAVGYPASDPNVVAVGGTFLIFDPKYNKTGETVWDGAFANGSLAGTGGGYSVIFPKPSWQSGTSSPLLTAATARCVPDISACASWATSSGVTNLGFYIFANSANDGVGGTSVSAPILSGITALVNQARGAVGRGAIGLLNPTLYPLAGSTSFNAITSGNNGAYTAGPIYNLCTGLGTVNGISFFNALSGGGSNLSNMSVRTNLAAGQNLVVGMVSSGAKKLLVRAIGPGLNTVFGLTGYYPDPQFSLVNSGTTIGQNDDWSSSLAPVFTSLGAFGLTAGSKDAALQITNNGPTTAQVAGVGSGVMLVEVYDSDAIGASSRLTNVSARNHVGTGADVLIGGFVINGLLPRQILVRGIGPGLHDVFGVGGVLDDPVLEIHQTVNGADTIVASNDNWDSSLTPIFDQVGAYHLTAGSKDAALLVSLPPGVYTAQIHGANSGTGDGVVELFEVQP
jgi:kumamolisin